MLEIASLIITQEELRHEAQIGDMINFVSDGGLFTREVIDRFSILGHKPKLIQISRFPDGLLVIHDGHHRLVSICIAGRSYIEGSEYELTDWTYERYNEINWKCDYITPFNPLKEVRVCDWWPYKQLVHKMLEVRSQEEVEAWIRSNSHLYSYSKTKIHTLQQLAECVREGGCIVQQKVIEVHGGN